MRCQKIMYLCTHKITVDVAQLVRATDCGSVGRGFESRLSPFRKGPFLMGCFYFHIFNLFHKSRISFYT